jgi:colanic acid/amylovoran biosynthesis glycosyltransferase
MADIRDTLLLYAPVPLYRGKNGFLLEDQACNGLRLWSKHFGKVIVMHPVETGEPPPSWIPLEQAQIDPERVEIIPLPTAYRPDQFFRHLPETRRRIRDAISRAHFLSFAIGGLFGDWGSVAAWEAHRMNRLFAVWTDRVESRVERVEAREGKTWRRRLRAAVTHRPMAALERFIIGRATVGLFHGSETFAAYAPLARAAELVHDIHLSARDHITQEQLQDKCGRARSGPLRLCYLGRADTMKGPTDWLEVMLGLKKRQVDFRAQWLGDGEHLESMRQKTASLGLQDHVEWPGFVRDRQLIRDTLRDAQLFVFCHKTPESPRNLIEALTSGTPIVGYDGAFPRSLIEEHGGGLLCSMGDTEALCSVVTELAGDRARLASLMRNAALDGSPFSDEQVFDERCRLIRQHLS